MLSQLMCLKCMYVSAPRPCMLVIDLLFPAHSHSPRDRPKKNPRTPHTAVGVDKHTIYLSRPVRARTALISDLPYKHASSSPASLLI